MKAEDLKQIVKEKYGVIAKGTEPQNQESCCCQSTGCYSATDYTVFSESYAELDGYDPDADLNLGCGIPTQFAGIKEGNSVLDLGSGAGNDCFVAHSLVGEAGKVTGLDFTDEMIQKAGRNLKKLGYRNVFFVKGDIEEMPFPNDQFEVVISNCVLNLVPDKHRAFSEIYRVLKPEGHFCVSDVVLLGSLPEKLRIDAEMYVGCVSGAIEKDEYTEIIKRSGFKNIVIHKQKKLSLPDVLLANYLTENEINEYKNGEVGVYSITVSGYKS